MWHVEASHPVVESFYFPPSFKVSQRRAGGRAGMQRGLLSQYMSERDRWSMPDSGLWIYPDLWREEAALDVSRASGRERMTVWGRRDSSDGRIQGEAERLRVGRGSQRRGGVVWIDCMTVLPSIVLECPCLHIEPYYIP